MTINRIYQHQNLRSL